MNSLTKFCLFLPVVMLLSSCNYQTTHKGSDIKPIKLVMNYPANKAIVLDAANSSWSKHIIGLPSVVKSGNRLAIVYDGNVEADMPKGVKSHMNRDIGLAWIDLPIHLPVK